MADFCSTILAIEPHGESRYFLQKTIESNKRTVQPNVIVCDLGASDSAGTVMLHKNPQNRGDNRIYPDPLLDDHGAIVTDFSAARD
jgi:hypothetical protein